MKPVATIAKNIAYSKASLSRVNILHEWITSSIDTLTLHPDFKLYNI